MHELSKGGQQAIQDIVRRSGFGRDAVLTMLEALAQGDGGMAQFNHPEFGGHGQWMRGGMTMVSDMFNHELKARVDALCNELVALLAEQAGPNKVTSGGYPRNSPSQNAPREAQAWWPSELGRPSSTGSQNDMRYAYFAQARRLVIDESGRVTVYDTLDHLINGFSQQQSSKGVVRFNSQHGPVDLASLPLVRGEEAGRRKAKPGR